MSSYIGNKTEIELKKCKSSKVNGCIIFLPQM